MSRSFKSHLSDDIATVTMGNRIAAIIEQGAVIYLHGDLGAGKTTFTRGIVQGFGHTGKVKSPTYTLVEPYELERANVYHFDLYRLGDPEELEYMGFRDYLVESRLCLIEWPERGAGFLPEADILIEIVQLDEGRKVTLSGQSEQAKKIISQLDREKNGVNSAD